MRFHPVVDRAHKTTNREGAGRAFMESSGKTCREVEKWGVVGKTNSYRVPEKGGKEVVENTVWWSEGRNQKKNTLIQK